MLSGSWYTYLYVHSMKHEIHDLAFLSIKPKPCEEVLLQEKFAIKYFVQESTVLKEIQKGKLRKQINTCSFRLLVKANSVRTGTIVKNQKRFKCYVPAVFSACCLPASLSTAMDLIAARNTAHRKTDTGSIPISSRMQALSLLRRRATMSGLM